MRCLINLCCDPYYYEPSRAVVYEPAIRPRFDFWAYPSYTRVITPNYWARRMVRVQPHRPTMQRHPVTRQSYVGHGYHATLGGRVIPGVRLAHR